jgi:hypothetical protein
METINDIVSEMRHDNEELKKYADRIEKAHENASTKIYMTGVREGVQDITFKIRHSIAKFIGEYGIPEEDE